MSITISSIARQTKTAEAGLVGAGFFPAISAIRMAMRRAIRRYLPSVRVGGNPAEVMGRQHRVAARLARRRGQLAVAQFHEACANSLGARSNIA